MKQRMSFKAPIVLFFLLAINTLQANAQTESVIDSNNDSYITMNIFSPISVQNMSRWSVGYIQGINEKWKAGIDFGYGNETVSPFNFGHIDNKNYQLWEVRPELYYILDPARKTKKYFSTELFYINHSSIFRDGEYYTESDGKMAFDKLDYKREKYGFNLKYGFIIPFGKKLGMNVFTGAGLRIREVRFSNIVNPRIEDEEPDDDYFGANKHTTREGVAFGANFSLGCKLYFGL
ncbi:MAG: DUF3575 domain-containing protein [Aequorivita sp.]|nr:DUF3575 domain-containing protein [Aequorivita sp.]